MFNFSTSDDIIPTLTFTKAELVYAVAILLADLSPTDNSTRVEMVEIRHYMNQIKDRVAQAIADGTIGAVLSRQNEKAVIDTPSKTQEATPPSMAELRQRFPSLSEEEIKEILSKAKAERQKEADEKKKDAPPPPSFIAKPDESEKWKPSEGKPLTPEDEKRRENSRKFAQMLGSL